MRCYYNFLVFLIFLFSGCIEKVHVGPHISQSNPASGPQGTQITIEGERFGLFAKEANLLYRNVPLEITEWKDTKITAVIGKGFIQGPGELRVMSSDEFLSNPAVFSVTPAISSIDPATAPVGNDIVIAGTNFSSAQGNSSVVFSSITAQEILSWSDNSIKVRVPDGAQSGTVKVIVQDLESNGLGFTVSPLIISLNPEQGPVGSTVTITGKTFGQIQGSNIVSFNGVDAGPAQTWEDTRIVIAVPPLASTGPVRVTRDGVSSNEVVFSLGPMLAGLSPTSGSSGTVVLLSGLGFGINQGTSQVRFGGIPVSVSSWADTNISFIVPSWANGGPNSVDVLAGNVASNNLSFIVTPYIGGVWPSPAYGGQIITINGTGFGQAPGSLLIGGLTAAVTSWSQGIITAVLPQAIEAGVHEVVVLTSYGISNAFPLLVTPYISSLNPGSGSGGNMVTLTGSGFGALQGTGQVLVGGIPAQTSAWSNTLISIVVPDIVGPGPCWTAVIAAGLWSNSMGFTVLPSLQTIAPNKGSAGMQVLLTGANLWSSYLTGTVYFNGGTADSALSWVMASIVVTVPTTASTGPVFATIGPYSTNALSFTITPRITSLNPAQGPIGSSVVISGSAFGPVRGTSIVTFGGASASVISWSNTSITALVPSLPVGIMDVVVTVGGEPSNSMPFTVIPYISSIIPASAFGGDTFTVNGLSFGFTQGTSILTLGGTNITPSSWSNTMIESLIPVDKGGGSYPVVVTVSGIQSNSVNFGIRPFISGITPTSGTTGTPVTLTGTNFGSSQMSSTVTFNGVNAGAATSWTMSAISISVPAWAETGPVVVSVGGQQSNAVPFTVTGGSGCQGSGGQYFMGIVPFSWNSAADPGSGSQAIGSGIDDLSVNIPVPFSFSFYDISYASLWASSNALIDFNNINSDWGNVSFPCSGAGCDMLSAPYWDDLITSASGQVRYGTSGTSPNRTFVITWINMNYYAGGPTGTFQVLLSEGTNQLRFQYFTISTAGGSATVGLNQGDGVRYNSFTPSSLVNQMAIRFCPPPPPLLPACAGFFDNMESGTGAWTSTGFWHRVVSGGACSHPAWSPVYTWWYGMDATCNYNNGAANSGNLTLPCVSTSSTATLSFRSWEQTENAPPYDSRTVLLSTNGGGSWTQVWNSTGPENTWRLVSIPLSGLPISGNIMLRFRFDTLDSIANSYKGWYIDDVGVTQP